MKRICSTIITFLLGMSLCGTALGQAYSPSPPLGSSQYVEGITFDQRLGEALPLDVTFRNEAGETVTLGRLFNRRPIVLTLVYYECPRACVQVLGGMVRALRNISLNPGSDYDVIVISIDPRETSDLAASAKLNHVEQFGRPHTMDGWHFLTGEVEAIDAVADAIGYGYRYDPGTDEYIHPSGLVVATPTGELSRYLYGTTFSQRDLRLSIVEAAESRIGSAVDQILLLCLAYDPATGAYSMTILTAVRAGGVLTLVGLISFIGIALYREQRRRHRTETPAAAPEPAASATTRPASALNPTGDVATLRTAANTES